MCARAVMVALLLAAACAQEKVNILVIGQEGQEELLEAVPDALRTSATDATGQMSFSQTVVVVREQDNDTALRDEVCRQLQETGHGILVDLTWGAGRSKSLQQIATAASLPYFHLDVTVGPTLRMAEAYLRAKNATDVAVVLEGAQAVNEAITYLVERGSLRTVLLNGLDDVSAARLKKLRPVPSFYVMLASAQTMHAYVKKAQEHGLMSALPDRWVLTFTDFDTGQSVRSLTASLPVSLLRYDLPYCCALREMGKECEGCAATLRPDWNFVRAFVRLLAKFVVDLMKEGNEVTAKPYTCGSTPPSSFPTRRIYELVRSERQGLYLVAGTGGSDISPLVRGVVEIGGTPGIGFQKLATYNELEKVKLETGMVLSQTKKFYRIGITHALPWSYQETDPVTKTAVWTGYCIDLIRKFSERMDFDYELVTPKSGTFGSKDADGEWNGVVGDLVRGETDIAVAALTMTAVREEVIDFVAPYYEQTGISIVMRKPVRKTSLFRFMTVLKMEVWLSIVGALVVTGFMIWFLDKYSPYSARNNGKQYPYPCRDFTLKESFWFALTSFTPQGGGEAPKALSGRTLVAAYWLFVVLMLATFTANLAAFLTVERMQSPVQSLEQLAKQSRINYTVVQGSATHRYFINMKFAEDTLYRLWKELTLNASTDDSRYRVWDYPIKEQYGHILLAINDSGPVANPSQGFRQVDEHTDADFAFIHDASEIRYELSRNCNFTEVGETFAERPYAVAVQQGSHLQEDISREILELQKDRFFETLKARYWNNSAKGVCADTDDSEGITLESLGGVFIATLFGLALAMVTLLGEVLFYKRKKAKQVEELNRDPRSKTFGKIDPKHITIGPVFKPAIADKPQKVSYVSAYPGHEFNTFLN